MADDKDVRIEVTERCQECNGCGGPPINEPVLRYCVHCGGTGRVGCDGVSTAELAAMLAPYLFIERVVRTNYIGDIVEQVPVKAKEQP